MTFQEKEKTRGRLFKLMESLGRKKTRIDQAERRLSSMRGHARIKPSSFRKFMRFMDQVASLRKKERDIISEIESIERKHRILRKKKLLKTAKNTFKSSETDLKCNRRKKNHNRLWLILFLIFLLLEDGKKRAERETKPAPR